MPNYDYLCDGCGPFTARRPMADYAEPQACPECGTESPRAILRSPNTSGTGSGEPSFGGHTHSTGCGCGATH